MPLTLTRLITAALLIASAAAFAAGAAIEHHMATSEARTAQRAEARHAEAGPAGENPAGPEGVAGGESPATHPSEHGSETLLGINPEATALVVTSVAVSLILAGLVLIFGSRLLTAGVALVMLAFTALGAREVTHQLSESHAGLATLAATIAALHLGPTLTVAWCWNG